MYEITLPKTGKGTLPETNISPENRPLYFWRFRTWKPSFLGAKMLVSGRVCTTTFHYNLKDPVMNQSGISGVPLRLL